MQEALSMPDSEEKKKNTGFIIRVLIFIPVLSGILFVISLILMPKSFINSGYPVTSSILSFYDLPEDSLDVLFLGSSHAISGFDTQELYDDFSIRSHTLGSGEQNMAVSFFYLKEALKTQKPKAVVLDTLMVFPFRKDKTLYSSPALTENALNFMKPGLNKYNAVFEIASHEEEIDPLSLIFPFLRYHERWKELDAEDYLIFSEYSGLSLHGFKAKYNNLYSEEFEYTPFKAEDGSAAKIAPVIQSYLDRIVELCKDNDIVLLLVKTPSNKTGVDEYLAMRDYADRKGLKYLDFNEEELYRETGFDFKSDMGNIGHANLYGARKITHRIGTELKNTGISGKKDKEWESTGELYRHEENNFRITIAEDTEEYRSLLKDPCYSVFLLYDEDGRNLSYTSIDGKETLYDNGEEISGTLPDRVTEYCVKNNGEERSILINNKERIETEGSRNAVVYDSIIRGVVDSAYTDNEGRIIHE